MINPGTHNFIIAKMALQELNWWFSSFDFHIVGVILRGLAANYAPVYLRDDIKQPRTMPLYRRKVFANNLKNMFKNNKWVRNCN